MSVALVCFEPFTGDSARAITMLLNTRRSWFGPVRKRGFPCFLVEPPGSAPGSAASIAHRSLSPYPAETGISHIGVRRLMGSGRGFRLAILQLGLNLFQHVELWIARHVGGFRILFDLLAFHLF